MKPFYNYTFELHFQNENNSFEFFLLRVHEVLEIIGKIDEFLGESNWLLSTGFRKTSYLYPVFVNGIANEETLSKMRERTEKNDFAKRFGLWNGQEGHDKSATIECAFACRAGISGSFSFSISSPRDRIRIGDWNQFAKVLGALVNIFCPIYAVVETTWYRGVFKDRPGVGWMLYLPRHLSFQDVPEARAIVPVIKIQASGEEKTLGTILVSVIDVPFTEENPEHVEIAHAMEIRLVDQDFLPLYKDL